MCVSILFCKDGANHHSGLRLLLKRGLRYLRRLRLARLYLRQLLCRSTSSFSRPYCAEIYSCLWDLMLNPICIYPVSTAISTGCIFLVEGYFSLIVKGLCFSMMALPECSNIRALAACVGINLVPSSAITKTVFN